MKKAFALLCLLLLAGCQSMPLAASPSPPPAPAVRPLTTPTPTPGPSPAPVVYSSTLATPEPSPSPTPSAPSSAALQDSSTSAPGTRYPLAIDSLPIDPAALANPEVLTGLTPEQRAFLLYYGFVAIPSGDENFKAIRRAVSSRDGQPYFLTTDAAYHALHVAANDLLPAVAAEVLRPRLLLVLRALYAQIGAYALQPWPPALGADILLAHDYCAVALQLLDPSQPLDPPPGQRASDQLAQIERAASQQASLLLPGYSDDFSAYRPLAPYAASPTLRAYFRAAAWLSRAALPARSAAVLALALRETGAADRSVLIAWEQAFNLLKYLSGPSLGSSVKELGDLLSHQYGPAYRLQDLQDETRWQSFQVYAAASLRAEDSLPAAFQPSAARSGWRMLPQPLDLPALILQSFAASRPSEHAFPGGLLLASAFGSPAALAYLDATGMLAHPELAGQVQTLQDRVGAQPAAAWLSGFNAARLSAFLPQLAAKEDAFPPFMRSQPWAYKDLTTALAALAEQRDGSVYLAPLPAAVPAAAPRPPVSPPPPAYAEPQPDVFYRLAAASAALCAGLQPGAAATLAPPDPAAPLSLALAYRQLCQLSAQFERIGQVAEKELHGLPLESADFAALQTCLEYKECLDQDAFELNSPDPDPLPGLSALASSGSATLYAGTGRLNRVYVAVPLAGRLQIAQGGIFSYYEFKQSAASAPIAWQERLAANPPSLAEWQLKYLLPGGGTTRFLAFRTGDIYRAGPRGYAPAMRLYAAAARDAQIVALLKPGDYLQIVEGPAYTGALRWWKVQPVPGQAEFPAGWLPENQFLYVRSSN